jgi:hypothetical protein
MSTDWVNERFSYLFNRYPVKSRRALEILPGFFSWGLILFPIWGSLIIPKFVAYYIIAFCVYWVFRSLNLAVLSIVAHFRIKAASFNDWQKDLEREFPARWHDIQHAIVIPTYQEPETTLIRTLTALSKQTFPSSQLHIMLSFEEREGEDARQKAKKLQAQFAHVFGTLAATFHPDIEGEVKGKSSNTAWGARQLKKILVDQQRLPLGDITITSEDADAMFHPSYFAALTYYFLNSPAPYNRIWQGAIMFYNNIWQVPTPVRVLASLFSVLQMYVLVRSDRLINFSTYSTSLQHIVDIDFWDADVIPEDYRLFFKSYFAKKGNFAVEAVYLPIYADAAEAHGWWNTMRNQYEQLKRWAWGVSDDPYIIRQFLTAKGLPFWDKALRVMHTIEDHFLWPVNWFAITVSAFFPPLLNQEFGRTILGKTLPQVTSTLLTISLISMLVVFVVDALHRPPHPKKRNLFSYILQPLEFLLLPVIGFFFSALPGIDAHTRLMLGKYLEYRVTEKV